MPKYCQQRLNPTWIPINVRLKMAKLLLGDKDGTSIFMGSGNLHAAHLLLEEIISNLHEAEGVVGIEITGYSLASAIACLSVMSHFHALSALYLNENCVTGYLKHERAGLVLVKKDAHEGHDLIQAVKILRSLKYKVLGVVALINYQKGAIEILKEEKVPFYSIFSPDGIITEVEEWNKSINS